VLRPKEAPEGAALIDARMLLDSHPGDVMIVPRWDEPEA